jgi:DNA replication initiation complex subunit (GINS family)
MKTYGPFAAEDVASMPVENARILVKQGMAAMIDTS